MIGGGPISLERTNVIIYRSRTRGRALRREQTAGGTADPGANHPST